MSDKQPEALRLADALERCVSQTDADDQVIFVARWFVTDAAALLRTQHALLERAKADLEFMRFTADHAWDDADYLRVAQTIQDITAQLEPNP